MKTKLFSIIAIIAIITTAIIVLAIIGCKPEPEPVTPAHVHQWGDWIVTKDPTTTEEGEQTKTCATCGEKETQPIAKLPEQPITKTYPITFKDGQLVFTVEYKALPSDEEPTYLTYLETRLGLVVNSEQNTSVSAVTNLMSKGNSFKITIVYTGESFTGMYWAVITQSFTIHNDWISTASGSDFSASMIRMAFNWINLITIAGYDENGVPYYGALPNGVKIYKGEGADVTDAQMATAVQNAIDGYNRLGDADKTEFTGIITKIVIISDKNYSWDGSVIGFKFDRVKEQIAGRFEMAISGGLPIDN